MATTYSSDAPSREVDDVSDGHLLDLFICHKDESAFAELVRRHGRMVLGVCQRVLANPHDAEDCFQAAFLVLVRKATTIQPREMVGNWLYGVAYRTALEAKKMAARRRNREKKRFDMPRPEAASDRWVDLQPLLDQEMSRLPDKYRFVLIACDIEGRTRKDVAQALALPEGTVASRLARARTMLAKRLTRRNLVISGGMLAALLADKAAAASVPASLAASTGNAAARLAAGKPLAGVVSGRAVTLMHAVVRSMLLAKLKIASAVIAGLVILGLGLATLLPSAMAQKKTDAPDVIVKPKKVKPEFVEDCVLQKVDLASMRIQATRSREDDGATAVYDVQVTPTTAILIDGQDRTIADLQVGASINVELKRDAAGNATAVLIECGQVPLEGVVHAVTDTSITIESEKIPDGEKKYDVEKGAWVVINGKKAKFGDLKPKMQVAVHVSVRKPAAVFAIIAAGPKVAGVLKALDTDRKTLSLGAKGLAVAPDAAVTIDGKAGRRVADLRPGMQVTLQMSADESQIVAITASRAP